MMRGIFSRMPRAEQIPGGGRLGQYHQSSEHRRSETNKYAGRKAGHEDGVIGAGRRVTTMVLRSLLDELGEQDRQERKPLNSRSSERSLALGSETARAIDLDDAHV